MSVLAAYALAQLGDDDPALAGRTFETACNAAIAAYLETLRCDAVSPLGNRCEDHAGHLPTRPMHKGDRYREVWL